MRWCGLALFFCCVCFCAHAGEIGKFLHITDLHIDDKYYPGGQAHCFQDDLFDGLGCCRKDSIASTKKPNHKCSVWGDYNCDASFFWTEHVLDWIAQNVLDIEFVVNTGDAASHHDLSQTPWENDGIMHNVTRLMAKSFPNLSLFNSYGNHDGWPVDTTTPGIYEIMQNTVASFWAPYLNSTTAKDTLIKGGYYVAQVRPGLQFISLNILFEDHHNTFFKKYQSDLDWDPQGMWAWLNGTLQVARQSRDKVWLGFHFGPSGAESSLNYDVRLTQLMDDYNDVITATFCGHTHLNEFFIYHTYDNRPIQYSWPPGSLKAAGHNPQFNIVYYDKETTTLVDFDHYECDLNTTIKTNAPACNKTYSLREAYGVPDATVASAVAIFEKISTNSTFMQFYYDNIAPGDNYDNTHHPSKTCDDECRQKLLRSIPVRAPCPYPNVTRLQLEDSVERRTQLWRSALQPQ